jgi:hypothetical protein
MSLNAPLTSRHLTIHDRRFTARFREIHSTMFRHEFRFPERDVSVRSQEDCWEEDDP